ncbi:MAG: peptidylprolyl isomerase [Chthoniobacteraceae bacterium]
MKASLLLVALVANSALRLHAVDNVTLKAPIANIASTANSVFAPINLRNHLEVAGLTGAGVRFDTVLGAFTVDTFDSLAPNTVTNFLRYVNESRFTNSFIHRSDSTFNVIQGGSYLAGLTPPPIPVFLQVTPLRNCVTAIGGIVVTCQSTAPAAVGMTISGSSVSSGTTIASIVNATTFTISAPAIANGTVDQLTVAYPPIAMETTSTALNNRGTIAMARQGGNLNSATGGWFINTADNPGFEPASALSGNSYCVFGQVIGTGMSVVDAIRARPILDFGFPLLIPYVGTLPAPDTIGLANLVTVSSMRQVFPTANGQNSFVQITLTNTNPSLVPASLNGSTLNLPLTSNRGGTARLAVTGTDRDGTVVNIPFSVTVTGGATTNTDLSGDAIDDIILQNGAGQILGWAMNGTGGIARWFWLYTAGLGDWRVMKQADVNGDGFTDLILQNNVGQVLAWFFNGNGGLIGATWLFPSGLGDWRVVGVADISQDGAPDIILQNSAGLILARLTDGRGTPTGWAWVSLNTIGDFRVVGVTDINRDAINDVIFQNTAGQILVWLLNGTGSPVNMATGQGLKPGPGFLYSGALGPWRVATVSDMNRDGIPDLVMQYPAGQILAWLLDGTGTAVNLSTGAGLKPGSGFIYTGVLGDWRVR